MGWSFAGCHISYIVTNLFKTIHTASGGCSQLPETFSNSAIVLWTINNYNLCKTLSQCLYCLWSSSSTMIVVVTVVVIILINSITVVIVVVVIIITTFFMSPLYLAAWSLASPCIVFTALSIFVNCSGKKKLKKSCLQKQGSKWWNFSCSTSFENPEIFSSIASSVLTRMLGACQKTFGQFYASLNRRITKEVLLPKWIWDPTLRKY